MPFFEFSTIQKIAWAIFTIKPDSFNELSQQQKEIVSREFDENHPKTMKPKAIRSRFIKDFKPAPKPVDTARKDIAIIGMSGIMPGSANLNQFWEHLSKGICLRALISSQKYLLNDGTFVTLRTDRIHKCVGEGLSQI